MLPSLHLSDETFIKTSFKILKLGNRKFNSFFDFTESLNMVNDNNRLSKYCKKKQLNYSTILAIHNRDEPLSGAQMMASNVTLVTDFTLQVLNFEK